MDAPNPTVKRPSLFVGGLVGFLVAVLIASILCWILAAWSGNFDNQAVFTVFTSIAALCTLVGYRFAACKRRRLGVNEPSDEWQQFFGSATFNVLAAIVLFGSFVISATESLLFDLVYGAPWLQNR